MLDRRTFMLGVVAVSGIQRLQACSWGTPEWLPNPVLEPTQSWEGSCAMPFSDGCFYDADRGRFRLWYMAGYNGGTALAESTDGYAWTKLGIVDPTPRDSSTIWQEPDGSYVRATYFMSTYPTGGGLTLQRSPDGIRWRMVGETPKLGDRSTIFPSTGRRWILSARDSLTAARARFFYVADRFEGPYYRADDVVLEADQYDTILAGGRGTQLYNLDGRSLKGGGYLGLMAIWSGDRGYAPKHCELSVGLSVDGVVWERGPRRWIVEGPEGSWREGNIQSCGGLFVQLADGLLGFYVSARSGPVGPVNKQRCVTGLVTLPVDGLCVG